MNHLLKPMISMQRPANPAMDNPFEVFSLVRLM